MMRAFPGFSDRAATTRIPTLWLRAVLAEAESLAELKVSLHAMRLLDAKRTSPRYIRTSELRADAATVASLQATGGLSPEDALAEGVRLAVARGVFLALPVAAAQGAQGNSPAGERVKSSPSSGGIACGLTCRRARGARPGIPGGAGALPCRGKGCPPQCPPPYRRGCRGAPLPGGMGVAPQSSPFLPPGVGGLGGRPLPVSEHTRPPPARRPPRARRAAAGPGAVAPPVVLPARRPTIFELYEQNIGLLTPLIVEDLREAAETYPPEWLEEAFREAVGYNRRHWRYVRRILEKWATEGRGDRGVAGGRPQAPRDPRRFIEGRYGHIVQH